MKPKWAAPPAGITWNRVCTLEHLVHTGHPTVGWPRALVRSDVGRTANFCISAAIDTPITPR